MQAVVTPEETAELMQGYHDIAVSPAVAQYIMELITATRKAGAQGGVSTRGAIALYQASQVKAAFAGRDFVIPEDVKAVALPILGHRLVGNGGDGTAFAKERIDALLAEVPVPTERISL